MEAKWWYQTLIGESGDGAQLSGGDLGVGTIGDGEEYGDNAIRTGKIAHGTGIAVDDHVA